MLRRAALVRTDVSEERIASIISVARIGELGTLAVTNSRSTLLMIEAMHYSETSVLTRATLHNIPKYDILHSHHRENHTAIILVYMAML
jgi:hypothetical protein